MRIVFDKSCWQYFYSFTRSFVHFAIITQLISYACMCNTIVQNAAKRNEKKFQKDTKRCHEIH